ncbi:MAG: hypothetical protein KH420_04145 [Clostridiales bacterium]|nr:hypothetical protein [Clostridiales bacterium]
MRQITAISKLCAGLLLLAALAGCSQQTPGATTAEVTLPQQAVQADETQTLVTLQIPADYLPAGVQDGFDATAYAVENGFTSAALAADGSLTITMTQRYYDAFLAALHSSIAAQMELDTQTDYITAITYSEDFSSVTLQVDRAGYETASDFIPSVLVHLALTYQVYTPAGLQGCAVAVYDQQTGQLLDEVHSALAAS